MTETEPQRTVAIVGAGIVGVATAIWLQRAGHHVVLVDPKGPGAATSFGNGGILAACACVPVTVPGVAKKAPGMLLDRDGPLFLRWPYLPRLLPWLRKYLAHATPEETARIARALHPLVSDSLADHQALAEGTGAERFIVPCDYLYLYGNRAAFAADGYGWGLRRDAGWEWEEIEGAAVRDAEPLVGAEQGFAARMGRHGRVSDPGAYVEALAAEVVRQGGRILRAGVEDIVVAEGRVTGLRAGGETLACDDVVIAAGAWSAKLCARLGLTVPLESERGYHMELWEPEAMLRAPLMVASGKFVATPMDGRIRLAGIVEFGGVEAPASRGPEALLERGARRVFPDLRWGETKHWMGHRPALADSLPAIGPVPGVAGAWLGFGHHHVGLTAGAITGRLLAQGIAGLRPNIDLAPYAPARFQ